MSITVSTTVEIDAPKQLACDVLTDFSAYHEWNPYMEIEGTPRVGTKLTVHMGAGGGRGMVFKPAATPDVELRWVGFGRRALLHPRPQRRRHDPPDPRRYATPARSSPSRSPS